MSWWYGDYSALLYEFVRGEEVKGMKKIDAKEMRKVNGGSLTLLVAGWAITNIAIYGGSYALCWALRK